MNNHESLRLVETLRSGIPSRKVSAVFAKGREDILQRVTQDLECISTEGKSSGLLFQGQYGEGKSHLLNQIFNEAESRNFVVSLLPLSKETPFHNLSKVYPKVAAATYLPGSVMPGFEWRLRQLNPNSEAADNLLEFCSRQLHPKIGAVLNNYFRGSDLSKCFLLYSDLAGQFIKIPDLRAIHRLKFHESLRMSRFTKEHTIDYFRFLGRLFRELDYSGWIILFDEAELIGKLGIASRAKAYLNMYPFLFGELESTYAVFSFTTQFFHEYLHGGTYDLGNVPLRLQRTQDHSSVEKARRVLEYLRDNCPQLPYLNEEDIRDILLTVRRLHGEAYQWEPTTDVSKFVSLKAQARPRSKIRGLITALDLRYLYGRDVEIGIGSLDEGTIGEDEAFFNEEEQQQLT